MKVNFVTKEDDIRGVAVIELLSVLGYSTRILRNGGQPKSVMDIAVFTPVCDVGLDLPKKSRFQGGGKYFCCSGNKIKPKDTPVWAKLPLKIVVKEVHIPIYPYRRLVTKDFLFLLNQKNKKDELSDLEKFVHAVQVTARMFESWYPEKEGYAVPWKKYQNGEGANFLLNKEVGELLTRDDVVVAKKILTELKKHGGYYVRHPSRVLQVSPDFIELSAADAGTVSKNGGLLWDYWQQCILVYNHALSDKHLKWVVSSISGPLSSKQLEIQKIVSVAQKDMLPLFCRADLTSIWFMVEVQERIGGMGFVESWLSAIRDVTGTRGIIGNQKGMAAAFCETVRSVIRKKSPVIVLTCPPGYEAEQNFFAGKLNELGFDAYVVSTRNLVGHLKYEKGEIFLKNYDKKVDFLYRREINLGTLATSEIGRNLIEASLANNIIIEPPLSMLYDCKSPMAWVHHPDLDSYFSPEVKAIIPPTALLPADPDQEFILEGKALTLNSVVGKNYVVKYSGEDISKGLGGRSVYTTRTRKHVIDLVLSEIRAGHPWVIQPMDKTRIYVNQLVGNKIVKSKMATRMLIHFARPVGKLRGHPIAACATSRSHWKAIGSPDAVFQELRVRA